MARGKIDTREDDRAGHIEELQLLLNAVSLLSWKLRQAVVLHYLQGFTISEAADVAGVKEGTFKSRLNRALETLRQDLGVILPNTALQLTERALRQTKPEDMQRELEISKHAQSIAKTASYVPTREQKRQVNIYQLIEDNIGLVEQQISKESLSSSVFE